MALSILLVSACAELVGNVKSVPTLFTDFNDSSEYLLKEADSLPELQSTEWQLAAVQALTKEAKYVLADSVIEHLQGKVWSEQDKNHLMLLIADNQYAQNQLDKSLASIKKVNSNAISFPAKRRYLELKINLYSRNKQHQAAVETLFQLTPMLVNDKEKQQYNDLMLTELNLLSADELNKYKTSNKKVTSSLTTNQVLVQGWYALGSLYQKYQFSNNQLIRAVDAWKKKYPTHPAINAMPIRLSNLTEAVSYEPTKIAVLLPLTGRYKKPAKAIQYGISHAFYNQSEVKQDDPTDDSDDIITSSIGIDDDLFTADSSKAMLNREFTATPANLVFFDTNKMSMQAIANQLHQQKFNFVIGPLLKPNVEKFLPLVKDIPVLALNSFPVDPTTRKETPSSSIHYAFPLSPEGEAAQAAEIIFRDKLKKPLVFAPTSDFGRRTAKAFEARWKQLSDEQKNTNTPTNTLIATSPAETYYFADNNKNYKKFLANALQIHEGSKQGSSTRRKEVTITSRSDVDAIYIIGSRQELTFMKSFLSVALNPYAPKIALYASSRSHATNLTKTQNKELEGLTFSDLAFLMDENGKIHKKIQTVWPKQGFATLRLFALGYDSYNLISQLKPLQVIDGYHFQGLVGDISLDKSNTINSQLNWAQYQNGNLVEVTSPIPSK